MSSTCPSCGAQIAQPTSTRCLACGRSLAQVVRAAEPTMPPPEGAAASGKEGFLAEYLIHIIIGLLCGIAGFIGTVAFFGRLLRKNGDNPMLWIIFFVVGFCLPAAWGFHYSYKQALIARRRKREGIKSL